MQDKIFIDTNIFVEISSRTGEKTIKSAELFKKSNLSLITTDVVIYELEWILRSYYKVSKTEITDYFKKILSIPNLEITNRNIVETALDIFISKSVDWVDAMSASYCQQQSITKIYTYDKHFNKIKTLTRLEP